MFPLYNFYITALQALQCYGGREVLMRQINKEFVLLMLCCL